jgi:putative Mg2+ transporter-C (MgtC) family protein
MVAHMAMALVLGWSVGYERHFSGRAAGSQVYCLVCATSCAVTLLGGYPSLWYWGTAHESGGGDPTRVIGSIPDRHRISRRRHHRPERLERARADDGRLHLGLVGDRHPGGRGLLPAGRRADGAVHHQRGRRSPHRNRLPARAAIAATLRFRAGYKPRTEAIHGFLAERGLSIAPDSLTITHDGARFELQCMIIANTVARSEAMNRIAVEMAAMADVESFTMTHSSRA